MNRSRTLLYLTLFVLLCGPILFYHAANAPILEDENLSLSRLKLSPVAVDDAIGHWHAIDHPALFHWVDRAILRAAGVEIGYVPEIIPAKGYDWNVANRAAPRRPVMVLRYAGAAALTLAAVCVFFMARAAVGGYLWGFLIALPVVVPPYFGRFVAASIKTDAYLALLIALAGLLLLRIHLRGRPLRWPDVALMGVVAGLAVSTKLNGGLILIAYAAYLAAVSRGVRRFVLPAAAAAVAFAVFVAVNPIMWHGGAAGWLGVIGEMLRMRAQVLRIHTNVFGEYGFGDRLLFLFPLWYLLPVFAFFVVKARREKWFLPVALWAGFLILGTVATTAQPFNRYRVPLDYGMAVLVGLSLCQAVERLWRREVSLKQFLTLEEAAQ